MIQILAMWTVRFILKVVEWYIAVFMPNTYMDLYKGWCRDDALIIFDVDN